MNEIRRVFIALLSIASVACSSEHPSSPSPPDDEVTEIIGLVISNAIQTTAYVSAAPRTFSAEAKNVSIRNETSGGAQLNKPISGGGFDPVRIDGKEGDKVSVAVYKAGGELLSLAHIKVPLRSAPRVVRTTPANGQTNVAVDTPIEIVFSEPLNQTTVTPASVQLVKADEEVDGTVAVSEDGLVVRFTPAAGRLEPVWAYRLTLASDFRDLDSEPIQDTPVIVFTTVALPASGEILVVVETISVSGAAIDEDGYFVQIDGRPAERIGSAGERRFEASTSLHAVSLFGMSDNCSANDSHRSVDVASGVTTIVRFQVLCSPPPSLQGMLVFLSERDGNSEIYTSNADGTGIKRLTNNSFAEYDPEWSPDGKKIAFARSRGPEDTSEPFYPIDADIYIMDADGSNVVRLTDGGNNYHPVWSPDGHRIAYAGLENGDNRIRVIGTDGPPTTPVIVGWSRGWNTDPTWSPDGQWIIFASDWFAYDFATLLFRVRADGSELPTLFFPVDVNASTLTDAYYLQPSWSPNGSRVAFAECDYFYICWGPGRVAVVEKDGSGHRTLVQTSNIGGTTWSPDGAYIAYSSQTCMQCSPPSIYYVSADGSQKGLIMSNAFSPSWRPSPR